MSELTLRRANPSDFDFIYQLHRQEFFAYIQQTWGWQEAVQLQGMQDDFDHFPFQIICFAERDIGAISIVDRGNTLHLNYLAILSEYQRRSFGTQVLKEVLEQATLRKLPVKLSVMRVNPAKDFYQRLGFAIVDEDEACFKMEWRS